MNPQRLTTPQVIDEHVAQFCRTINPEVDPVILDSQPEEWCRQACCDTNVRKYIEVHGGSTVCGYRIWYNKGLYIEAERHAVWASPEGEFRDISFSADGEKSIVFVPDVPEKQCLLDQNRQKIRQAVDPRVRTAVEMIERFYSRGVRRLNRQESWNTMPTYAEWKEGRRVPAVWLEARGI